MPTPIAATGKPNSRAAIFVAHPSEYLTDHLSNGDGLIAHGFLSRLASRGFELHIAADKVSLQQPLPENATVYPVGARSSHPGVHLLEYMVRMRMLFERLSRQHRFGLALQLNPVFPGISLALLGTDLPLILGTYVPRWGKESEGFTDRYTGSRGVAARVRDAICSLQQRHADALLITTPAAMNRIPDAEAVQGKLLELPHGIDAERFFPRDPELAPSALQTSGILFLANLLERKGIFTLLQAFESVAERVPESRLTIGGGGADLDRVQDLVRQSAYRERIDLLGPVARDQTPELFRQHALYCLPSFGEPYATTLLEAMASGLAIVSTRAGGTPYLVPEQGGLLVAPGDVPALAAALISLLSSPARMRAMGQLNRQVALERYTWDAVLDRLEGIYFEVSGGAVGPRPGPPEARLIRSFRVQQN